MDQLSKRQQKTIAKIVKQEESKDPHGVSSPEKTRRSNGWMRAKVIFFVFAVIAGIFWLKAGESWYYESVGTAESLEFDPYKVLDVTQQADLKQIKQQFRKLSLEWHPDKRENCDAECQKTFERINESYKILANPKKRKMYDTTAKVFHKSESDFNNEMHPYEFTYSPELWDTVVMPSLSGHQMSMADHISGVWLIFVANGSKSKFTEHILPLWSDLAAQFYGRVSFLRLDADAYPDFENRMPFRIRVKPAFFMMSPTEAPLFFSDMSNFSPQSLAQWITESMPNPFIPWTGSAEELAEYIKRDFSTDTNLENGNPKIPVAVISKNLHSTSMRAVALRTLSTIEWIQPPSSHFMDHMGAATKKQIANIKEGSAIVSAISGEPYVKIMSAKINKLDHVDRHSMRAQNEKNMAPTKYLAVMHKFVNKIIRGNSPSCVRENAPFLCGLNNSKVYCNVMLPGRKRSSTVVNWGQDHNATIQDVILPPKHKTTLLSRMLDSPDVKSVLLQLNSEKLAAVTSLAVREWEDARNYHNFFPSGRLSWHIRFSKWLKTNYVLVGVGIIVSIGVIFAIIALRRFMKSKMENKKD